LVIVVRLLSARMPYAKVAPLPTRGSGGADFRRVLARELLSRQSPRSMSIVNFGVTFKQARLGRHAFELAATLGQDHADLLVGLETDCHIRSRQLPVHRERGLSAIRFIETVERVNGVLWRIGRPAHQEVETRRGAK
jgi:hypothetical protein